MKKMKTKAVEKVASKSDSEKPAPRAVVQEALQVTWVLKGHLKNVQVAYLRVGALLSQVREKKLYAALRHANLEQYAEERLRLGRASLYRYLQVYDWVREFHPEWLEPKPKGFIPDLNDVADLMWIERKLAGKGLSRQAKTELEALREKALKGRLRETDLDGWRQRKRRGDEGLKSLLASMRSLRRRGSQLKDMPAEAIKHLDSAIEIIRNALASQRVE